MNSQGYYCVDCRWHVEGRPTKYETAAQAIDHHIETGHTVERAGLRDPGPGFEAQPS